MPRKSRLRTFSSARWIRWALMRAICNIFPSLKRRFNFPMYYVPVQTVANRVFHIQEGWHDFHVDPHLLASVVMAAKTTDAGDTSRYDELRSKFYSAAAIIENGAIDGRTMQIIDIASFSVVGWHHGSANWNETRARFATEVAGEKDIVYFPIIGATNYYHFIYDNVLPLLWFLGRWGSQLGHIRVVYRERYPTFVRNILKGLVEHYPQIGLQSLRDDEVLNCIKALFARRYSVAREWVPFETAEIAAFRETLFVAYHLDAPSIQDEGQLLYVSRKGARLRALLNEDEIEQLLTARGFVTFMPHSDDHASQVRKFAQAKVVIAVHGAALANLIFCKPGTHVIELFPQDHIKSPYLWLSAKFGLTYTPVFGSKADLWQGFSIDADAVEHVVDDVLRQVGRA